jgi:hypothetical protein
MKRTLQIIFGTCLISAGALAQPTLTAAGYNPVVGDQFTNIASAYMSPGSAGANQTWNLSTLTMASTSTTTVVAVSATTYSASFPSCNIAITGNGTSFEYFNASAAAYQAYGSGSSSSVDSYSNPEDRLRFPLTYANNYVDYFSSVYMNGGNTVYRSGSTTITVDGYGTLTNPAGTFSNVLRVHNVMTYHDSSNTGGNPSVTIFQRDQYLWYLNGNHTAITSVNSFTITPPTGSPIINQGAGYLSNATTGIASVAANSAVISLYPNPASGNINIAVTLEKNQQVEIKLFNSLGSQTGFLINKEGFHGTNEYHIDTQNFAEGIYFAQISINGVLTGTRRFVIQK